MIEMQLNSISKLQSNSTGTTLKNRSLFIFTICNSTGTHQEESKYKNKCDTCSEKLSIHLRRFKCILNVIGSVIQIEVSRKCIS